MLRKPTIDELSSALIHKATLIVKDVEIQEKVTKW